MSGENETMIYVGFCRLCGTGPLGLRRCGACGAVVVLCDECDAVWQSADFNESPTLTDDPALPCPTCTASLMGNDSAWATREDLEATEWIAQAVAEEMLIPRVGPPMDTDGPDPTDELLDTGG